MMAIILQREKGGTVIRVERPDEKRLVEPGVASWSVREKEISEFP